MNGIKVILVASFLGMLVWGFRNRARVGLRAGARVAVLGVIALAVTSVVDPDVAQWAAELVGVTRGTDLVLYLALVLFAVISIAQFMRFRDVEYRLSLIVRARALERVIPPSDPRPEHVGADDEPAEGAP